MNWHAGKRSRNKWMELKEQWHLQQTIIGNKTTVKTFHNVAFMFLKLHLICLQVFPGIGTFSVLLLIVCISLPKKQTKSQLSQFVFASLFMLRTRTQTPNRWAQRSACRAQRGQAGLECVWNGGITVMIFCSGGHVGVPFFLSSLHIWCHLSLP